MAVTAAAPTALVYSPSLQGHRTTYCSVFADLLIELGYQVVVAGDVSDRELDRHGPLAELAGRPGVKLLDIAHRSALDGSLSGLAELAEQVGAHVTLLPEADGQLPALAERQRRGAPELQGRVVGLFIRSTNYIYTPRRSAVSRLRRRLGGATNPPADRETFHENLFATQRPLDAALVLDEHFAAGHTATHRWMPDIFREFDLPPAEPQGETRQWAARLQTFLAANTGRPVIVYVGAVQARRGYTDLLRLAKAEDGCVVHCGQLDDDTEDVAAQSLRAKLAERGALLETKGPYLRSETADEFLRAARAVVLPYPRARRSGRPARPPARAASCSRRSPPAVRCWCRTVASWPGACARSA
jgi:hypothetical protein